MSRPAGDRHAPPIDLARRLELASRRLLDTPAVGHFRSAFRGGGWEFAELREYQVGDDQRAIDWKVTARLGRPFVRRFHEERQGAVLFVLDRSASMEAGWSRTTKAEQAALFVASLGTLATASRDRVGLLPFAGRPGRLLPPTGGAAGLHRLVAHLALPPSWGRTSRLDRALSTLLALLHESSIVFIVSDFLTPNVTAPLAALAARHDVICVRVTDPGHEPVVVDRALRGLVRLRDPESGETVLADGADPAWRAWAAGQLTAAAGEIEEMADRLGLDLLDLSTGDAVDEQLIPFLRHRQRPGSGPWRGHRARVKRP